MVFQMSIKMKCKIVTFKEVYNMTKRIAETVKTSKYQPTIIIGLARGGWVPARLMCDFLGLTDLISLKCEHWLQTGRKKDEATIKYPFKINLKAKKILLVDDIADTGKSLITSIEYLKQLNPLDLKTATMQHIPQSKFKPDYFAEEVKDWTWYIYPWNWIEDTSTLITRFMTTQKDRDWNIDNIEKGLEECFEIKWNKTMLRNILRTMIERGQIETKGKGKALAYKLKKENVIQL